MITVAGTPPQKRQKGGVFRHRESIKGNYNEISLPNTFNVSRERFGFTPRVTDDSPDDGVLAPTWAVPPIVLTDRPTWPELLRNS